jgi:hypothetical protein
MCRHHPTSQNLLSNLKFSEAENNKKGTFQSLTMRVIRTPDLQLCEHFQIHINNNIDLLEPKGEALV